MNKIIIDTEIGDETVTKMPQASKLTTKLQIDPQQGINTSISKLSLFPEEKKDKDTLLLMSISQQNLKALEDSSAEKFKQGMRILYEDEYGLLNKIQKNAKYENTISSRKLETSFKAYDSTI